MKVRDIMTTDIVTATPESTLEDVAMMMRDEDTGAIPVLDGEDLVGIVTDRDIVVRCVAEGKDAVETTVEDIITQNMETIEPDSDVNDAREIMSRIQIRRLPVVQDGQLVGMISIGDIAVKTHTDVGNTLENVSEGVKPSGRAKQSNRVAAGGSKKPATRRAGPESQSQSQGSRSKPAQSARAGGNQARQNKVAAKRVEPRGNTRRKAG